MLSLILIPLGIFIFLNLNRHYQFAIFSIVALYPVTLGNLRSIPSLLVIEWLAIVALISLINQLVPVYSTNKGLQSLKFKGIEIFLFAILILIVWVIISLINNEIFPQKIVTGKSTGAKRAYFDIFNNVLIFFTTIIFFASQYEKLNVEKFLKTILYTSIIIGLVRALSFYLNTGTPLLSGIFDYNPRSGITSGQRLLGLDYVAAVGVPAIFGLYIYRKKLNFFILLLLLLFLFLSGGRTAMLGVTISVVIFSIIFLPKNFVYFIVAGGVLFSIAVIFLPVDFLEGKLTRLSTLQQTGFMGQDLWRGTAWKFFLKNFSDNPVFGRGISDYSGFIYSTFPGTEDFVRRQMVSGGHGSYFSLLSTLGLGGIIYFIILVFGGIFFSFRKIVQNISFDRNKTAIAVFCFMLLINASVIFITGWNGLTDVQFLFYTTALICSIKVMENNPKPIQYE